MLGDWQRHVKDQVTKLLVALHKPDVFSGEVRFVRHSPGRRRNDSTMYHVCMANSAQSEAARSKFSQFIRRDDPLPRPPELMGVAIHPLVCLFLYACC